MTDLAAILTEAPEPVSEESVDAPVETVAEEVPAAVEPPVKDVKEERSAARFAALAKQEKALRAERESLRREKAEIESARIKWSKIGEAPLDVLKENGLDPEEFVRRVIDDGKPSTEFVLSNLQKELAELKAERAATVEAQKQSAYQHEVSTAKSTFASWVEEQAELFPLLYEFDPVQIGEAGWNVAHELVEELDRAPTQAEIAGRIEENLSRVQRVRDERKAKLAAKKVPVAAPVEKELATVTTLTNSAGTAKASSPRELTEEERDLESMRILRAHGWR